MNEGQGNSRWARASESPRRLVKIQTNGSRAQSFWSVRSGEEPENCTSNMLSDAAGGVWSGLWHGMEHH